MLMPNKRLKLTAALPFAHWPRILSAMLGDFQFALRRRDNQFDTNSRVSEHFNESVDAEQMYFALQQITDPRLSHPEHFGRFRLLQTLGLNDFAEVDH